MNSLSQLRVKGC